MSYGGVGRAWNGRREGQEAAEMRREAGRCNQFKQWRVESRWSAAMNMQRLSHHPLGFSRFHVDRKQLKLQSRVRLCVVGEW